MSAAGIFNERLTVMVINGIHPVLVFPLLMFTKNDFYPKFSLLPRFTLPLEALGHCLLSLSAKTTNYLVPSISGVEPSLQNDLSGCNPIYIF